MPAKKTWTQKLNVDKTGVVKRTEVDFADIPAHSRMYISTPLILDAYIRQIPKGRQVDLKTLRKDLALENEADNTCPLTTGIFLRIVAEAAYERFQEGMKLKDITPFWRVIAPGTPLAKKLSFGEDFLIEQRKKEKL